MRTRTTYLSGKNDQSLHSIILPFKEIKEAPEAAGSAKLGESRGQARAHSKAAEELVGEKVTGLIPNSPYNFSLSQVYSPDDTKNDDAYKRNHKIPTESYNTAKRCLAFFYMHRMLSRVADRK